MENSLDGNQTLGTYTFHWMHLTLYLIFTIPWWIIDVIGNILVLLCVYREKQLHRPSYYLVAALSLADVAFPLFGYVPITYQVFYKANWFCDPMGQFYILVPSSITGLASFLTLVALTSERYLSIAFPVYHRKSVTNRRVLIVVVVVWIASAGSWSVSYPFQPSTLPRLFCAPFQITFLAVDIPFCATGLVLLSLLNAHLLILIKRRLRKEVVRSASQDSDAEIRRCKVNAKASKAVSTVVIFFVICWLPLTLFLLIEGINYKVNISGTLLEICRKMYSSIFLINGAINPIVYARQSPQFRTAFRKLLGKAGKRVGDVTDLPTTNTVTHQ